MTIRLLDPPLHEFLPEGDLEQIVNQLTADTGMSEEEVYSRIEKLSEVNPMLGFRGCRFHHTFCIVKKVTFYSTCCTKFCLTLAGWGYPILNLQKCRCVQSFRPRYQ